MPRVSKEFEGKNIMMIGIDVYHGRVEYAHKQSSLTIHNNRSRELFFANKCLFLLNRNHNGMINLLYWNLFNSFLI